MSRRYSNGQAWMKRMRMNRRLSQHVREVDERDLGNRLGVERVLGLDGEEWSIDSAIVPPERVLGMLAHRWFTREQGS